MIFLQTKYKTTVSLTLNPKKVYTTSELGLSD